MADQKDTSPLTITVDIVLAIIIFRDWLHTGEAGILIIFNSAAGKAEENVGFLTINPI